MTNVSGAELEHVLAVFKARWFRIGRGWSDEMDIADLRALVLAAFVAGFGEGRDAAAAMLLETDAALVDPREASQRVREIMPKRIGTPT